MESGKILMQVKLKKITNDASFREFYRIQKNFTSSILVRANKDIFKNLIVYAAVNKLLIANNIKIIEWAEIIKNKPNNRLEVYLTHKNTEDLRNIEFKGFGKWEDFNAD